MGAEAQAITARTPDTRLTVPRGGGAGQLAVSFNIVLDRLGNALSTQRRFMADASHELRTPISILRTAADVTLSRDARDEGEYREALAAVSQQASRLTRLVDDMLVLARAAGGGYPVVLLRRQSSRVTPGRGRLVDRSRRRRLPRDGHAGAAAHQQRGHHERVASVTADHGPARGDAQRGAEHHVAGKMPIVDQT